jgi:hypothetical protein
MTMYYTRQEEKALEDIRKDHAIENAVGRKPGSTEERERVWKLLQDAALS